MNILDHIQNCSSNLFKAGTNEQFHASADDGSVTVEKHADSITGSAVTRDCAADYWLLLD